MRPITTVLTALACCGMLAGCKQNQPGAATSPAPANGTPYAYRVVLPPSQSDPAISEIDLNDKQLTAPGPVAVLVKTSDDVSSITARMMGRAQTIPKVAAGQFGATQRLPDVPFFLKGRDYTVDFVATTDDGRTATAQVVVHLNR